MDKAIPISPSNSVILWWGTTRMSRRKRRHLKSPRSLTVSSASWSHSGCLLLLHSVILWWGTTRMSRRKRRHLKSPRSLTVSSASWSHSGCLLLLHQSILLTLIPFVPWQLGLPFPRYNLTLKIQGQMQRSKYPSQCSIPLTHFLSVSHQDILLTPVPFVPWQSGLPILRYNLTLKIQGQMSRWKVPQSVQCRVDSFT